MFTARHCKASTHSSVARLVLPLALAVVLGAGSVSAQVAEDQSAGQLSGLWELTFVNLTPAGFLPDPVLLLGNFTRDGSFLNTTTHPESGVPVTAAFGIPIGLFTLDAGQAHWIRTGPRHFVLETWRFVFATENAAPLGFTPGQFVGFVQAQTDVTLNKEGDKMTGRARFQLLDTNKQPMFKDFFFPGFPGAPPVVADATGFRVPLIPIPIP